MNGVTGVILLVLVARAAAKELAWPDELAEKMVDRTLSASPCPSAGLDTAALGKSGQLAMTNPGSSINLVQAAPTGRYRGVLYTPSIGKQQSGFLSGHKLAGLSAPRHAASKRARVSVQANLFDRFSRVVKSNLDSVLQKAEDPEKIIDQAVAEMQGDVVKTKQEVAKYMATLKQTEAKYNAQAEEAAQWMKRAELALSKGDEDLAREALKRKKTAEELAGNFKVQLDNSKQAVDQLISNARLLEQKVADAKAKKTALKARAATARSSKQIQEIVSGVDESSALGAFERMEQKVLSLEAETEAVAQLKAPEKDLEDQFKALESGDSVDDELMALKGKMLGSGSQVKGSLPAGKPVKDAIDVELEELRKKSQDV